MHFKDERKQWELLWLPIIPMPIMYRNTSENQIFKKKGGWVT